MDKETTDRALYAASQPLSVAQRPKVPAIPPDGIVERLRERAKTAREEGTGTADGDAYHFEGAANEIERLQNALKPFAAVAESDIGQDETDVDIFQPMRSGYNREPLITVGDLRRASQVTSTQEKAAAPDQYEFPYQQTFEAIAAATEIYPSKEQALGLSISVKKFQETFNGHRDRRPLTALSVSATQPGGSK